MRRGRVFRKRRKLKTKSLQDSIQGSPTYYDVLKWMGKEGFKLKHSKKLKPYMFEATGRGLLTEEAIYAGDVVVSIPENLLMKPLAVLEGYLGPHIKKCYPGATGHEILTVYVMCEKSKGEASFWYSYIATLPSSYTIPAYCDSSLVDSFPVSIRHSVFKQMSSVKNSFEKLNVLFISLENSFPEFHGIFQYDSFLWAWSTVNTRCVYFECENQDLCKGKSCSYHMALAPFFDLMNHHYDAQVDSEFNKERRCFEIKSSKHFKKYSQVFINYGDHCNRELFVEYGFVLKNNFNDIITISPDEILSACRSVNLTDKFLRKREKFVHHSSVSSNIGFCMDGLTWTMDVLLKILCTKKPIRGCPAEVCDISLNEKENSLYMKLARAVVLVKLKEFDHLIREKNDVKTHAMMNPVTSNILNIAKYLYLLEERILLDILHYLESCNL